MLLAVSGELAFKEKRHLGKSHSGRDQYQTYFLGKRAYSFTPPGLPATLKEVGEEIECHVSEVVPDKTSKSHFHQTNQFQVMAAGAATLDGVPLSIITLHYGDRYTVFGELTTGPKGLCLFTICNKSDPGGIYMNQQGAEDLLRPSKGRSLLVQGIGLSTQGVLQNLGAVTFDSLFGEGVDVSDGLGAFILRMGGGMKASGPDPRTTGGQFYLVINGGLSYENNDYAAWSVMYADSKEPPLKLHAGPRGAEALIMNFPRLDG